MMRHDKVIRAMTERINRSGSLTADTLEEFIALLKESEIYADDALYDLLANIWTLPDAFSPEQIRAIIDTIIEAPFDKITTENIYVIADILLKTADATDLDNHLDRLKQKKSAEPILRFLSWNKIIAGRDLSGS